MDIDETDNVSEKSEKQNESGSSENQEHNDQFRCEKCEIYCKDEEELQTHKSDCIDELQCEICLAYFSAISSLDRHKQNIHTNQKNYDCKLCGAKFLNMQMLTDHKDTHIQASINENKNSKKKNKFRCMVCNKIYSKKTKLFEHMDIHSENITKCEYCEKPFTYFALQNHLKKIHTHEICDVCNESFFDKNVFITHEKNHFKVAETTCDYCGQSFYDVETMKTHMMFEHVGSSEENKCDTCTKVFMNERHLKHHQNCHLNCHICQKKFEKPSHLSSHMKLSHFKDIIVKIKKFRCKICKKVFKKKSLLASHLSQVHKLEGPYRCQFCKNLFAKHKELMQHYSTHEESIDTLNVCNDFNYPEIVKVPKEKKTFQCEVCKYICGTQLNLRKHMIRLHKKEECGTDFKFFDCEICSKSFISNYELTVHMGAHSDTRAFTCKICNKSYKFLANLLQHNASAHSTKTYTCEYCQKMFKCEIYLRIHKSRKHTEFVSNNLYTCTECGKIFPTEFNLKSHQMSHSSEKPFKCSICHQFYKSDQILKRHIRIVHVEKNSLQCEYCNTMFSTSTILNLHKYRKHKEKLPSEFIEKYEAQKVTCDICSKELPNKSRLAVHQRTHLNEKSFKCNLCDQRFTVKHSWIRHLKTAHSTNNDNKMDVDTIKPNDGNCNEKSNNENNHTYANTSDTPKMQLSFSLYDDKDNHLENSVNKNVDGFVIEKTFSINEDGNMQASNIFTNNGTTNLRNLLNVQSNISNTNQINKMFMTKNERTMQAPSNISNTNTINNMFMSKEVRTMQVPSNISNTNTINKMFIPRDERTMQVPSNISNTMNKMYMPKEERIMHVPPYIQGNGFMNNATNNMRPPYIHGNGFANIASNNFRPSYTQGNGFTNNASNNFRPPYNQENGFTNNATNNLRHILSFNHKNDTNIINEPFSARQITNVQEQSFINNTQNLRDLLSFKSDRDVNVQYNNMFPVKEEHNEQENGFTSSSKQNLRDLLLMKTNRVEEDNFSKLNFQEITIEKVKSKPKLIILE